MDGVVTRFTVCLLLAVALSGCGWLGNSDDEAFDEELPSLDAAVTTTPITSPDEIKTTDPTETPPPTDMSTGARFALRRRVEQELSQGDVVSRARLNVVSRTKLELDYSVSIVEIVADGGRRFGIHYDRVRYSGQLGDEAFEYDSTSSGAAPLPALPYRGLVNNRFFFWIDQSGQMKLVGFNHFLKRCVQNLPELHRQAVLAQLAVISDADGVSRFVDATVGLLGNGSSQTTESLRAGLQWRQERTLKGEIPTNVFNQYEIESLDQREAKIKISGFVSSPKDQPIVTVANRGLPTVTVTGGTTTGSCTIDRQTGFPKASQIEQVVEMLVQLPDGTSFAQQKRTISTTERRQTQPQ